MKNRKRPKENHGSDEPLPAKKVHPSFSYDSFQKKLNSGECLQALEEFIDMCRTNKSKDSPANIFLKKGGKIMDIFNILVRGSYKNLREVSTVFKALHILLLRIQTAVPQQMPSAEEVCHRLVNNHLNQIHSMLQTNSAAQFKKIVLQLLTAIVTMNENLAKNVLNHVSLSIEVVDNIVGMAVPNDRQSVRICFIHFLMAFLVGGSSSSIRLLLKQRKMLTSIVPGLVYDFSSVVVFVLTTLRTKLVENMNISKTDKLHTFNTRVMAELIALYKWKGPAAFVGKWKEETQKDLDIIVNKEEKDAVADATHSLLLSLCTSFRHGIVFRDHSLGTSNTKPNPILISLIKEIKSPWDHTLLGKLAIEIVKVCPETARMFYEKMSRIFHPRTSDAWKNVIHLATEIIPSLSLTDLAMLDPDPACKLAIDLVAPANLLGPVARAGLIHGHPAVRLRTVEFLKEVLKATESVQSVLKTEEFVKFSQHLKKFLPNAIDLEKSWSLSSATDEKNVITSPSRNQQMYALVNLMLLYQDHFMVLLDIENKDVSLAHSLAKFLDMDSSEDKNLLDLQIKVLELLIVMDTAVLEPGKVGFLGAINVTLQANSFNGLSSIQAQSALGNLLVKCGVLESASADITDELGIWLYCYQSAERSHHPKIRAFLQEVLTIVSANPLQFIEQIFEVQQNFYNSVFDRKVEKMAHTGLADQLFQELLSIGKETSCNLVSGDEDVTKKVYGGKCELNNIYSYGISSLLICALDVVSSSKKVESSIEKYLCNVLVHLLHMQSDPSPFLSITKRWVSFPSKVAKYLYSWLEDKPIPLSDPFGYYSPECSLSRFLLQPGKVVPELEDSSNLAVIILRARLICFHIVQLCERGHLTETITGGGSDVMIALIQSLISICDDKNSVMFKKYALKFLNIVFKHPSLVRCFSPLQCKKKKNEKLITNFLLNLLKEVNSHSHTFEEKSFANLLKEKLLRNITYYLETSEKVPKKSDTLLMAVKLLSLTDSEMSNLTSKVKVHMMANPWVDLFVYLLHNVNNLPSCEVKSVGCILRDEVKKHEKIDNERVWIVSDALYRYFKKFPNSIRYLPPDLFQVLICKNGLNLASLMLQHHETCKANFSNYFEQEDSSIFLFPDVLGHLLGIFCENQSLPLSTLKLLYSKYEQEILKAMQSPLSIPNVFSEHHSIVKPLISQCMGEGTCKLLSLSLENNSESLEIFTPFHLSVIEGLHNQGCWRGKPEFFLKLLLQQMIQMLQHDVPDEHVIQLCNLLVQHLEDENKWDSVTPDEAWAVIPALFLKTALKESKRNLSGSILMVLSKLLKKVEAIKFAEVVFEMMISHSRFLDYILIHDEDDLKLSLLKLVLVCYQLSPQLMKAVHIPVWLGAYGASLSHCDQIILKILHAAHDNKNVSFHAYRPFLWGEAAVNHYTIRSQAGMSLWRIPQATAAIELLDFEKVENTIAKFPIFRHLLNEIQDECHKTRNDLEIPFTEEPLQSSQPEIYDPAFLLPLFSHLMAPESVVHDYKFISLGGLALTLASLGSVCKHIRAASFSVISRFYNRLNGKSPSVQLMALFIDAVRAGIIEMKEHQIQKVSEAVSEITSTSSENNNSFKRTKDNVGNNDEDEEEGTEGDEADSDDYAERTSYDELQWSVRLPNMSAVFIARASLVLINPSHELYKPLYKFLLARSALKLYLIPELKSLSRPDSVNFRSYQLWLLETVRCGMRIQKDIYVAKKSFLFKIIFSFFSSSLSDSSIRIVILQIVEATLKINKGTNTLIQCGLTPWLYSSLALVCEEKDGNLVVAFIRVIASLKPGHSSFVSVVNISPLLFYLPPLIENSDLLCILQIVQSSIRHVSKEHLIIVLRSCFSVLEQAVVEASAMQLDIPLSDIACKVNIQENESDEKKNKTREITELNITLQNVVRTWLTTFCCND